MVVGDKPVFVDIDIQGVEYLKLIVNDGGNGSHYDHANWGDAKLSVIKP